MGRLSEVKNVNTMSESKMNMTPAPWRADERPNPNDSRIPFAIIGNIQRGGCEPIADTCGFPPNSDGNVERQRNNANAIVSAVNNTYGKGINPEVVPDLLDIVAKFLEVADGRWRSLPATSYEKNIMSSARAIIKEAKIK